MKAERLGKSASLLSTAGIGLVNFGFTLIAMAIIDRFGRKKLMLIGSIGLIVTPGWVSRIFFVRDFRHLTIVILLFIYIAFFVISQGVVIWVFISEIFPNQVRATGKSLEQIESYVLEGESSKQQVYETK